MLVNSYLFMKSTFNCFYLHLATILSVSKIEFKFFKVFTSISHDPFPTILVFLKSNNKIGRQYHLSIII